MSGDECVSVMWSRHGRGRKARGGRVAVDEGLALLTGVHARQAALFPDHVETRRTAARLACARGVAG